MRSILFNRLSCIMDIIKVIMLFVLREVCIFFFFCYINNENVVVGELRLLLLLLLFFLCYLLIFLGCIVGLK